MRGPPDPLRDADPPMPESELPKSEPPKSEPPKIMETIIESGPLMAGGIAPGDYNQLQAVDSGDYVIGEEIARGGMGRILEGRDRRIGRSVAIKEILLDLLAIYPDSERELLLRRFEREARITARLEHPAIVPVYEIGRLDGAPFFAMKKVDGRPLGDLIDEAPTLAERLRLLPNIIAICEALGFAHDRGVVHRDLKPSNILVGAHGETVVIDWGLAKQFDSRDIEISGAPVLDEDDGLRTIAGSVFGTPIYMPPEQGRGEAVDRRADVYALGSILYHLLSGKPPYVKGDQKARKTSILDDLKAGPPAPLTDRIDDVPPDLLSIVEKAMARDKGARYKSAVELASDLRQFEAGQLVGVHDYSIGEHFRRWLRRHRTAVATAIVALVTLAVVAGALVQQLYATRGEAQEDAARATETSKQAMRLFSELGRTAFLRDQIVEGTFSLLQARVLGADVPGFDILLGEIERALGGVVVRIGDQRASAWSFSSDATTLALGFPSGQIRVVDPSTGEERKRVAGPEDISGLSISKDASRLIAASHAGRAQLWDLNRDELLATYRCEAESLGPDSKISAKISPSGEYVAIGCAFQGVSLYSIGTGEKLASFEFLVPSMLTLFSRDGTKLLISYRGTILRIHDLANKGVRIVDKQISHVDAQVSISANFEVASAVLSDSVAFFDLVNNTSFKLNDVVDNIVTAVVSPGGKVAILGGRDGHVIRYDLVERKVTGRWRAHRSAIWAMAFSLDEKLIATVAEDRVVRTWSADMFRLRSSTLGLTGVGQTQFSHDGRRLLVNDPAGPILIDSERDDSTVVGVDQEQIWLSYGPDSGLLVLGGFDKTTVRHRNGSFDTLPTVGPTSTGRFPGGGTFSASGDRIVYGGSAYDTRTLKRLAPSPPQVKPNHRTVISADGSTMASTSGVAPIHVWAAETGRIIRTIPYNKELGASLALALSPRGDTVVVGSPRVGLRFIDVATGDEFRSSALTTLHLIPSIDGERLITIGKGTVELWDVEERRRIANVATNAPFAAFAADGGHIITRSADGELLVSDGKTGKSLHKLNQGPMPPKSTILSAATGLVVTADDKGVVRLWDTTSGLMLLRRDLGEAPRSLVIAPDGLEFAASVKNRVVIVPIRRSTKSPGQWLLDLSDLYPLPFFMRNFQIAE